VVATHLPASTILKMGGNAGYTSAVNHGAAVATGDVLVILNPDAMPEPGFGEAIRSPAEDGSPWAAWMALVVCHENGRRVVNTSGNPVHFTGFSWAGDHGTAVPEASAGRTLSTAASGACLAIPLESWDRAGGFPTDFFLYHEDTDLSLRLRSQGEQVGILDDAVVDHEYDFGRSGQKWLWLERNRWAMIIRNYPAALILLLAPALVATELALLPVAARGGWLPQKLAAWAQIIRWSPRLLGERRQIQSVRALSALSTRSTSPNSCDRDPSAWSSGPTGGSSKDCCPAEPLQVASTTYRGVELGIFPKRNYVPCKIGLTRISLTSTESGCSRA